MASPKRYLPNLRYAKASSLDVQKHDIMIAQAIQDISEFVSEKIPDTNAVVHLFIRSHSNPAKAVGVKVSGVDEENVFLKSTVEDGKRKLMYNALLRVEGLEASELYRMLTRQGNPVMINALQKALDDHEAENTQPDEKQKSETSVSGSILSDFMSDRENLILLLITLHDNGVGIKGLPGDEFDRVLEYSFRSLSVKFSDELFIQHAVSSLSRNGYIKSPIGKEDHWMFGAKAFELMDKSVPKRLTKRPKKTRKKILGIPPSVTGEHPNRLNGSTHHPIVDERKSFVTDTSTNRMSPPQEEVLDLLRLSAALKQKKAELTAAEEVVKNLSSEVSAIETQIRESEVDKSQLLELLSALASSS